VNSLILQTAARVIVPLQIAGAVYLLLKGHNEPGGGFIAGLVAAVALGLVCVAFSSEDARRLLRIEPIRLVGAGLGLALIAGMIGVLAGDAFLTGEWTGTYIAGVGIGTPLLFDAGVFLLVVGMVTAVLFSLIEH
jgi:multicomponent Na+:H+ antiporter subunit B